MSCFCRICETSRCNVKYQRNIFSKYPLKNYKINLWNLLVLHWKDFRISGKINYRRRMYCCAITNIKWNFYDLNISLDFLRYCNKNLISVFLGKDVLSKKIAKIEQRKKFITRLKEKTEKLRNGKRLQEKKVTIVFSSKE